MKQMKTKLLVLAFFVMNVVCNVSSQDVDNDFSAEYHDNDALSENPLENKENDGAQTETEQFRMRYRQQFFDRVEALKKQLDNDADNVELLLETGNAAMMIADRETAIDVYRSAVKIMRNDAQYPEEKIISTQKKVIAMLVRSHNVNMAIVEYKNLTVMFPEKTEIRADFARFLIEHGFPRRAFEEYKKILAVTPDDIAVLEQVLFLRDQGFISAEEAEPLLAR